MGNKFINHAIQKGAKTIISNQKFEGIKKNILFIKSFNVRKSLSEFAYLIFKKKTKKYNCSNRNKWKVFSCRFLFSNFKIK